MIQSLAAAVIEKTCPLEAESAVLFKEGNQTPPLFLVHSLDCELFYVPSLATHLIDGTPVYGLPYNSGNLRTYEGMAAQMITVMREVTDGPYRVAGWSIGGLLAYEIATQLIGADHEVQFVGLIDTRCSPTLSMSQRALDIDERDYLLLMISISIMNESSRAALTHVRALKDELDFGQLVQLCHLHDLMPKAFLHLSDTELKKTIVSRLSYYLAGKRYSAKPIPIPLDLFVAMDEKHTSDEWLDWSSIIPKDRIALHSVPGNHLTLMQHPHISTLGQEISIAMRQRNKESSALETQPFLPITALNSRGAANPLYCVPGAGASIAAFIDLVKILDDSRPVFGLQPRGLDNLHTPHTTVFAASDAYIQAIDETSLHRPIHLLGHSFGGWVVFEMAVKFAARGHEIGSLILIDSNPPNKHRDRAREFTDTDALMAWIQIFELISERPSGISQDAIDSRDETQQRALLHKYLISLGLMPQRSKSDILCGPLRTFASAIRASYTPTKIYTAPVHLFVADDRRLNKEENLTTQQRIVSQWRKWAPNLSWSRLPGNHMTILKNPNVQHLAEQIQKIQNPLSNY